jgi:hypothetical protein
VQALKYFKAAFTYHWNLLLFLGGAGFALMMPGSDVTIPILLAAELAYVGMLGSHPKFQRAIDVKLSRPAAAVSSADSAMALNRILTSLPADAVKRFETLRDRCLVLRQLAAAIKDPGTSGQPMLLDDMQMAGLDRLLWIYVRLLFTQDSLERFLNMERFLDANGESRLRAEIADRENRLKKAKTMTDIEQRQKVERTLEDSLQTSRDRLANFQKARDNLDLVRLEIERLETKIRSLSELAVNRQEPDYISNQVDLVASSMIDAEKTINELQFATGLERGDDAVPSIVSRETVRNRN